MKNFLLFLIAFIGLQFTQVDAQNTQPKSARRGQSLSTKPADVKPYRIIFQLASGDTLVHQALMRQLNNMLSVEPNTQIEVVCHGPGLNILRHESVVADKIKMNIARGVVFNGCEFTMKEKNITRDMLLPEAQTVKAGILHIVKRQSEGWFYIKAGF